MRRVQSRRERRKGRGGIEAGEVAGKGAENAQKEKLFVLLNRKYFFLCYKLGSFNKLNMRNKKVSGISYVSCFVKELLKILV